MWFRFASGLLFVAASSGSAAEIPDPQEVQFVAPVYQSDETIELTAYLYRAEEEGPHPAIVDLHGCNGIGMRRSEPWVRNYLDWGFSVLMVDSFTPRGFSSVCASLFAVPTWQRALDAHAAKRWLQRQLWVKSDKVFLTGYSHGGTTILLSLDDELNGASPFAGAIATGPWCLDALFNSHTDLLILTGEQDQWTPALRCQMMSLRRSDRVDLVIYEDAYHGFDEYPGTDVMVQGYRILHDAEATQDAVRRAKAFLQSRSGF